MTLNALMTRTEFGVLWAHILAHLELPFLELFESSDLYDGFLLIGMP
jgi:hypothetical protein